MDIARPVKFAVAIAIADGVVADDVARRRQQPNQLVLPNDVIAPRFFLLLLRQMLWLFLFLFLFLWHVRERSYEGCGK